jgi:hypothetical protein
MAHIASATADRDTLALTASPSLADEILLEEPRTRIREFITLIRVMRDFIRGFRALHFVGPIRHRVWLRADKARQPILK